MALTLSDGCRLIDDGDAEYCAQTEARHGGDEGVSVGDVRGSDAFAYPQIGHRHTVL
jgi:hypothetical protein